MLYEWIARLRFCKRLLFVMREVEVIYREDQSGKIVWCRRKSLGESGDLPCLSGEAWDTIYEHGQSLSPDDVMHKGTDTFSVVWR
jgi:hypothetical protein